MVLSCQPDRIEEIPLFKRAGVTAVSLRNQRASSGGEKPSWLDRDSDLSGMLVGWHLWSSRSVPFQDMGSRTEKIRRASTEKGKKLCNSSLTLRKELLYMSIEKYLLFLMPREMTSKGVVYMLPELCSRQERFRLSALYVNTALGLRQYQFKNVSSDKVASDKKGFRTITVSTLSLEKVCFPSLYAPGKENGFDNSSSSCEQNALTETWLREAGTKPSFIKLRAGSSPRGSLRPTLSLHCPSVLGAPDVQDIAQSGLMTLEGSLTLELS